MQNLTGVHQKTSEQNKDLSAARQDRDWIDMKKIKDYINDRNPFEMDEHLVSISTGVHAHSSVNVDEARPKGFEIIKDMDGKPTKDYTFRRKNHNGLRHQEAEGDGHEGGVPGEQVGPGHGSVQHEGRDGPRDEVEHHGDDSHCVIVINFV